MLADVKMSNYGVSDDGTLEDDGLTKAVEDVTQHCSAQSESLREKQRTLSCMQAALSDIEKKVETAEQELRSKVRDVLILEAEMEHLEQQAKVLRDRCASLTKENTVLQIVIREEEEDAQVKLEEFTTYRGKMRSHREAAMHSACQTEVHKVLEEKRGLVRELTQKKEELREHLKNPNGNKAQMTKREIDDLQEKISVMRTTAAEREEQLHKEFETQTHIKKDIEIQNRRYEAIVKRLHCQLSRAQAIHRQMSEDIRHLERQLAELKRQLESSQDSVVSGQ